MKELLEVVALITGLFGVGLTLNASYKLFKQITGLREIKGLSIDEQRKLEKDDLYRDLLIRVNDEIKHANKLNEDEHKNDKKIWMNQIIWGSIISGLSIIFSYVSTNIPYC